MKHPPITSFCRFRTFFPLSFLFRVSSGNFLAKGFKLLPIAYSFPFCIVHAGSGQTSVYNSEWTLYGQRYIGSQLHFHPIPRGSEIPLAVTIATQDGQVTLSLPFTATVTTDNSDVIIATLDQFDIAACPDAYTSYERGDELVLAFSIISDDAVDFSTSFKTPSYNPNEIFATYGLTEVGASVDLEQSRNDEGDLLTTVTVGITSAQERHEGVVDVLFQHPNSGAQIQMTTRLLRSGTTSLFQNEDVHLEISTCDPETDTDVEPDGTVRFQFPRHAPNCVRCRGAGHPTPSVSMYQYGVPVGSGQTHSAMWHYESYDVVTFELSVENMQHMFSGSYNCRASTSDGSEVQRYFFIDVV